MSAIADFIHTSRTGLTVPCQEAVQKTRKFCNVKDVSQVLKARAGGKEGVFTPSRKGGSGDLPRENCMFPDVHRNDFNAL